MKSTSTYISDKKRIQLAILPCLIFALMQDAYKASKSDEERDSVGKVMTHAFKIYGQYIDNKKLILRAQKLINRILSIFVDKRDGTYHIRKVILCLFEVTEKMTIDKMINDEIALVVQDALNLEYESQINEKDWLALKQSASKKTQDVINLIYNV